MADQQNRGGKKQGGANPANTDQHQGVRAGESRRESSKPSDQGYKPEDEPKQDDPSQAPESGDHKGTADTGKRPLNTPE
jgi:hypothetical protein